MSGLIHRVIPVAAPAPDHVERSQTGTEEMHTIRQDGSTTFINRSHSSSAAEASRRQTHSEYATATTALEFDAMANIGGSAGKNGSHERLPG